MGISPSPEHLEILRPMERFIFKVIHRLNRSPKARRAMTKFGSILGRWWVELGTSKIVVDHGFENFQKGDPNKGVLLVVNHRTFYDQFVITSRLFRLFGAHHNVFFPVRSTFFYENLLGLLINLTMAVGFMYPPFVRDRKRRIWNRFATDLIVELLTNPDSMIGYHPEGTRNTGSDPYNLLQAKPGCGELIHRAQPNVIPVFLQGFPPRFWVMLKKNLFHSNSSKPLVHMVMGAPMDFTEECKLEPGMKTYLRISRKVMATIEELADREKQIRAGSESPKVRA